MALADTFTLDIPHMGGPAVGIIQLTSAPDIDTVTLDVPHMGGSYVWMQNVSTGAAPSATPGSVSAVAPDWLPIGNWFNRWRRF